MSTINENELQKLKNVQIKDTNVRAKGYGDNVIKFKGRVNLTVNYNGINVDHNFLVVNESMTSLLCRDLCGKLQI